MLCRYSQRKITGGDLKRFYAEISCLLESLLLFYRIYCKLVLHVIFVCLIIILFFISFVTRAIVLFLSGLFLFYFYDQKWSQLMRPPRRLPACKARLITEWNEKPGVSLYNIRLAGDLAGATSSILVSTRRRGVLVYPTTEDERRLTVKCQGQGRAGGAVALTQWHDTGIFYSCRVLVIVCCASARISGFWLLTSDCLLSIFCTESWILKHQLSTYVRPYVRYYYYHIMSISLVSFRGRACPLQFI